MSVSKLEELEAQTRERLTALVAFTAGYICKVKRGKMMKCHRIVAADSW